MKTLIVLAWSYHDKSGFGIVSAYEDQQRAERDLALLKQNAMVEYFLQSVEFVRACSCNSQPQAQPSISNSITDLDLPTMALNALRAGGIVTIEQLSEMRPRELLNMPSVGRKTLFEIERLLGLCGLKLAT